MVPDMIRVTSRGLGLERGERGPITVYTPQATPGTSIKYDPIVVRELHRCGSRTSEVAEWNASSPFCGSGRVVWTYVGCGESNFGTAGHVRTRPIAEIPWERRKPKGRR